MKEDKAAKEKERAREENNLRSYKRERNKEKKNSRKLIEKLLILENYVTVVPPAQEIPLA